MSELKKRVPNDNVANITRSGKHYKPSFLKKDHPSRNVEEGSKPVRLNWNFVKEGGDFPFCGFPELWVDKDGKVNLDWEIFFKEKLTFKEKSTMIIKEVQGEVDWMDYMDTEAMGTMLKVEGNVLAITTEKPSDPSAFILPTDGQLSNWTWVGFSNSMKKIFCNASSNVLFNIFNKMKSNLTYFDVSHSIEILHLNIPMNLKMELINNWKRKLNL